MYEEKKQICGDLMLLQFLISKKGSPTEAALEELCAKPNSRKMIPKADISKIAR